MYTIVIKPRAIKMAQKAYDWYEDHRVGLGDLFLIELERCYDKLEVSPLFYAKIEKDFRHILLKTFPYVVIFEIIDDDVIVYAVFHTSRNPEKKFRK